MTANRLVLLVAIISVIAIAEAAVAQRTAPAFGDYPVSDVYTGPNAQVRLATEADRTFRTRLRDASREKPNYAGHYVIATWGCGAECIHGAAIDVRTGEVIWWPATICCSSHDMAANFEAVSFRLNSRLIVLTGLRNEKEGDDAAHYYIIDNKRFVSVADVRLK